MANNGYVQIPPDSTGKKIGHVILIELDYDTGTIPFVIGERVNGATSGAEGTVVKIVGDTASGELYLALDHESPIAFTVGENLRVGTTVYAKAASVGSTQYKPVVSIVDHENSFNGVNVTPEGEMIISPAEGPFGFDSFGNLSVSQEAYLGLYHYEYGFDTELMQFETSSLGLGETLTTPTPVGGLAWSGVTLTNQADSGSISRVESHMYHPYNAGTGQKWIGSFNCGDTGTQGVVRRWGYFDNEDGLFFELSGSSFFVVQRSSVPGGVVTETRVSQSMWNVDHLDGNGGDLNLSEVDLDISKGRVYFIDFQWLGVGRVRWGVVAKGRRVVCHQIYNAGSIDYPYMRCGTLPSRFEQVNYNTAGGPVVMRNYSMAVIAASRNDPFTDKIRSQVSTYTTNVDWSGSFRPVFSIKSAQTVNGKENRSIIIPSDITFYSEDAPMLVRIVKWPTLTDATWAVSSSNHSLLGDITATTASGGIPVYNCIVPRGQSVTKEFPKEWDDAWKIHRKNTLTDENCAWTTTAQLLNTKSAPSSSLSVALNWREIQ